MHDCGALCTASSDDCTSSVEEIVADVTALAVAIAVAVTGDIDVIEIIEDIGQVALDLADSTCPTSSAVEFLSLNWN